MKNITISIMIALPLSLYSTSLSHDEIIKMVEKIKHERPGISLSVLDTTPNPFAIVVPVVEEKVEEVKIEEPKIEINPLDSYHMTAVLNHAAFINKKWYKVGDKIGMYKVVHVGKSSVTLRNGQDYRKLVIPKKKKKIKLFKGN